MPYPSIGPKLFWTVQIVLTGPNSFGRVQIILIRPKLDFTGLICIPNFNLSKMIWTQPKPLVLYQNDLDG